MPTKDSQIQWSRGDLPILPEDRSCCKLRKTLGICGDLSSGNSRPIRRDGGLKISQATLDAMPHEEKVVRP